MHIYFVFKKIEYIFTKGIKLTKYDNIRMFKENNMIGRPGKKTLEKNQKYYKNISDNQEYLSLDKKRSLTHIEKQLVWDLTAKHEDLDPSFFRLDKYNNVVIKTIVYSKDNADRVFAGEFEHIKPYSKGGRTDITNICLLNAGFNRSKGTKELGCLNPQEATGYSVMSGTLSGDQLVIELERDLHVFCTKYNLLIEKKNKLYSIAMKHGKFKPYTGEYAQEYKDYSKAPEFKPLSDEYQEHLKQEYTGKSYAPEYKPTKSYAPEYESYNKSYAPEYKPTKSYAPECKPYNDKEVSSGFIYPKEEISTGFIYPKKEISTGFIYPKKEISTGFIYPKKEISTGFIYPKKEVSSQTFIYPKKEISTGFIYPKKEVSSQTFIYPKKEVSSQTFIFPKNKSLPKLPSKTHEYNEYNEYSISDDSSKYTGNDDYGFIRYDLTDDEEDF